MGIDRAELKRQAREVMKLTKPPFWMMALVYFIMTDAVSAVLDIVTGSVNLGFLGIFLPILFTLYSYVVEFGKNLWSIWTWRRLDPGLNSLTQGFTITGQVILMELTIFLKVLGWALLFTMLAMPLMLIGGGMFGTVLTLFLGPALAFVITLRYALSPYLLADHPEDGAGLAVRRSADLMAGWKMELFRLQLSFLGWYILSFALSFLVELAFLSSGGVFSMLMSGSTVALQNAVLQIGNNPLYILLSSLITLPVSLWLVPYQGVTMAGFYEARLQAQQQSASMLPPL